MQCGRSISDNILSCATLQADITAEQINGLLEATGNKEVEAFYPIIFANFLSNREKLAQLIACPATGGGGGGGAGAGAAAEEVKEEEKVEEEEMETPGVDLFGGGDAGGGGDY